MNVQPLFTRVLLVLSPQEALDLKRLFPHLADDLEAAALTADDYATGDPATILAGESRWLRHVSERLRHQPPP